MDPTSPKPQRYHNFILSLWQGNRNDPTPIWHYRLENPHTGERHGFTSLEALARYLAMWTVEPPHEAE